MIEWLYEYNSPNHLDVILFGIFWSFMMIEYNVGDRALVIIDPRQHKALPHRRYHGKVGTIKEVGRRSVRLDVKLGEKTKTLITRFDHIKPFGV